MLKFHKYIFYRIYTWNLRTWGKSDLPEWNALFGVSFLIFLNIYAVYDFFSLLLNINIQVAEIEYKVIIALAGLVILANNYLFSIKNRIFIKFSEQFSTENRQKRIMNNYLIIFYIFLSFSIFFLLPSLV